MELAWEIFPALVRFPSSRVDEIGDGAAFGPLRYLVPRKLNRKGRSVGGEPFVHLPHFVIDSFAYQGLKPISAALLVHLIRRYNGFNNGSIGLGHREAAELCNVTKNTMKQAFDELEERGLVRASRRGGFNMKDPTTRRASEWRLTWLPALGMKATHDFKTWSETASK